MDNENLKKFYQTLSIYKRTGLIKECFHHNKEECKGDIKQSHSIQRNGRLSIIESEINGNQSIYTLSSVVPSKSKLMSSLKPIGKKEASTFFGFCDYHDSQIFSKIENGAFDNSNEHCFLHSYRSFAHSYHRKKEEWKAYNTESEFTKLTQGLKTQIMKEGIEMAIKDGEDRKAILDAMISTANFGGLHYLVYEKKGLYPFAVSSQISPMVSYKGNSMNNHLDPTIPFSQLMLTFLPDKDTTIAILAAFPDDKRGIDFLDELDELNDTQLEYAITSIILANCENTFFSPKFWNFLSPKAKRILLEEFENATNNPTFQKKFFLSQFNFFNRQYEMSNLK